MIETEVGLIAMTGIVTATGMMITIKPESVETIAATIMTDEIMTIIIVAIGI